MYVRTRKVITLNRNLGNFYCKLFIDDRGTIVTVMGIVQ